MPAHVGGALGWWRGVSREPGCRLIERERKRAEAPYQRQQCRSRGYGRGGNRNATGRELYVLDGAGYDLVVTAATGWGPPSMAAAAAGDFLLNGNPFQALTAEMHTIHQPRAGEQIRKEQK
ncbi:hypothetical protein A8B98_05840 [Hymenobacter sp. UV11]|nr:hypothetical protein A8B98_05840 [Hymenobacter sp. UV11]